MADGVFHWITEATRPSELRIAYHTFSFDKEVSWLTDLALSLVLIGLAIGLDLLGQYICCCEFFDGGASFLVFRKDGVVVTLLTESRVDVVQTI